MLDAYLIDNYLDMQLFYKAFELMKKRVFSNDYTVRIKWCNMERNIWV